MKRQASLAPKALCAFIATLWARLSHFVAFARARSGRHHRQFAVCGEHVGPHHTYATLYATYWLRQPAESTRTHERTNCAVCAVYSGNCGALALIAMLLLHAHRRIVSVCVHICECVLWAPDREALAIPSRNAVCICTNVHGELVQSVRVRARNDINFYRHTHTGKAARLFPHYAHTNTNTLTRNIR